ncbi:MAG: hypothetical protein HZB56_07870 [Deltaproteobacteria bacterium]|nr:hypothetical protein [Deltaproteobacteria bacterium]
MSDNDTPVAILAATAFTFSGTETPVPVIAVADVLLAAARPHLSERDVAVVLAVELAGAECKPWPGVEQIDGSTCRVTSARLGELVVQVVDLKFSGRPLRVLAVLPAVAWAAYEGTGFALRRLVRIDVAAWNQARLARRARA